MKRIALVGLLMWSAPHSLAAASEAWFAPTPLRNTYQQLAQGHPLLAWHELSLALQSHSIDEQHWLAVKKVILSRTQCGQALPLSLSVPAAVTVSFIDKTNQSFRGHQVKIAVELLRRPVMITLRDPQGNVLLEHAFEPVGSGSWEQDYLEAESAELLAPFASGLYALTIDGRSVPLVIAASESSHWAESDVRDPQRVSLNLPSTTSSCAPAQAQWQYFDRQFELLDAQPVAADTENVFPPAPQQARWQSVSVMQSEYQGSIRIHRVQRLTQPVN